MGAMTKFVTSTTINRLRLIRRFRLRNVEFPVYAAVKPARLQGVENGKVPDDMLVKWVDHRGIAAKMMPEFRRPWQAAVWAAWVATGYRVTFTSPADVYRTWTQQAAGWVRRMTRNMIPGRPSRMCGYPDGVPRRWWLKPGFAGIACPGTSNHGWGGMAVDHTTDKGRPVRWLRWFAYWAPLFGYSWEAPSEDWHIRYCFGDEVTDLVKIVESCRTAQQLTRGSTGPSVVEWQKIVGAHPDGQFGPKTEAATRAWQTRNKAWYGGAGLPDDGTVDADDWLAARVPNLALGVAA